MPDFHKRVAIIGGLALLAVILILVAGRIVESRLQGTLAPVSPETDTTTAGKEVAVQTEEAEVVSWVPETGILTVKISGKDRQITLRPEETRILVATGGSGRSGTMTAVTTTNDSLYREAFCPGNLVTLTLEKGGDKAVSVFNFGLRSCAGMAPPI